MGLELETSAVALTLTLATPAAPRDVAVRRALVEIGLGALLISAAPVLVRFADSAPAASAFWRLTLATPLMLLPFLTRSSGPAHGTGGSALAWSLALLTGVFFAADLLLFHTALGLTSIASSTLIVNAAPVLLPLLVWLLEGRRPGLAAFGALLLAVIGVVVLAFGRLDRSNADVSGDLLAMAAGGAYAVYLWLVRRARTVLSTGAVMAAGNAVGAACLAIVLVVEGASPWPGSWTGALAILGLAMLGQVLGQGLIARGLGKAPPDAAGALLLLPPVATTVLGWLALGETLAALQVGGAILVLVAVFMVARGSR